jgi:hypothetical protein
VIGKTIDIAYSKRHPSLKLSAPMNPPTVEMTLDPVSQFQLRFHLHFKSGTFVYMDYDADDDPNQTGTSSVAAAGTRAPGRPTISTPRATSSRRNMPKGS